MELAKALRIQRGDNIALVGGGGKTSAMIRLGNELATNGLRVLLTTTTHISKAQATLVPTVITYNPDVNTFTDLKKSLREAFSAYKQVLLIGPADTDDKRVSGVDKTVIDKLAVTDDFDVIIDVIINEADGSKKRPFKAPAPYEPVIPSSTSLVVPVVGLDVLGQPLNDLTVHRASQVAQLTNAKLESPVTSDIIIKTLTHPEGGLKNVPSNARVIPLLNKLDLADLNTGQLLIQHLLNYPRIDSAIVGSIQQANSDLWINNRVVAIILAAGKASRFGSPKQLALWNNKPLIAHTVDTALASLAERVIVVLGAHSAACRAALGDRPVEFVENDAWAQGQSTSMKAGLAALPENVSSAIFLLADQPRVTTSVINAVISVYQQTLPPIAWPEYEGKRGNPVLIDRTLFAELNQVTGDVGARPVLQAHRAEAKRIAVSEPGILHDVDTPADLPDDTQ